MKILTPMEAALLSAEKNLSSEDFLNLQKQLIQAFAEGYITGDKKSTAPKIKKAILNSELWRTLNNPDLKSVFQ